MFIILLKMLVQTRYAAIQSTPPLFPNYYLHIEQPMSTLSTMLYEEDFEDLNKQKMKKELPQS